MKVRVYKMTCKVKLVWDSEGSCWITETKDIPGLVLCSLTFDDLINEVQLAAPELLELNCNYSGPVHILFDAERLVTCA
jgi:hypothetical protein